MSEPMVFFNEALPYFAVGENSKTAKDYGGGSAILVQYPQYFSNVTRDDFLDNKNSGYYTIWQV